MTNRIVKCQETIKQLENELFTEKDLRGLSQLEKEFVRGNGYHVQYDQPIYYSGGQVFEHYKDTFYLFIARNLTTGKKQLYAITKAQSIAPNDKTDGMFNSEKWLVLDTQRGLFSKFNFERRFMGIPNVKLIFAKY